MVNLCCLFFSIWINVLICYDREHFCRQNCSVLQYLIKLLIMLMWFHDNSILIMIKIEKNRKFILCKLGKTYLNSSQLETKHILHKNTFMLWNWNAELMLLCVHYSCILVWYMMKILVICTEGYTVIIFKAF